MKTFASSLAVLCMCLSGIAESAAVYRCTDAKNMVQSQLTPCAPGEKQEVIGTDGKTAEQRLQDARDAVNPYDWHPHVGMSKGDVESAVQQITAIKMAPTDRREKYKYDAYNCWTSFDSLTPDVNRTTSARGVREQWVFRHPIHNCYLYIVNDVVTSIQD